MYRKVFSLDRNGLAQCYDTSGGVGIAGRVMADTATTGNGGFAGVVDPCRGCRVHLAGDLGP